MIKVKLEIILNNSWDEYITDNINEDLLLEDILTTLSDQRSSQEEVDSITIISKHLI